MQIELTMSNIRRIDAGTLEMIEELSLIVDGISPDAAGREVMRRRAAPAPAARKANIQYASGPALTGSYKQKVWAEKIRASFKSNFSGDAEDFAALARNAKSAKFWIESRGSRAPDLVSKFAALVRDNNKKLEIVNRLMDSDAAGTSAETNRAADEYSAANSRLSVFLKH